MWRIGVSLRSTEILIEKRAARSSFINFIKKMPWQIQMHHNPAADKIHITGDTFRYIGNYIHVVPKCLSST